MTILITFTFGFLFRKNSERIKIETSSLSNRRML